MSPTTIATPGRDAAHTLRLHSTAATGGDLFEIIRARKGWDTRALHRIADETPAELDGIDAAARRLRVAIVEQAPITIITDFDMDGISAGTLMYAGLKELGANVNITIPDYRGPRQMTPDEVDDACRRFPGTSLIITCDGGINSRAGIAHAQDDLGVDIMVTDHHVELEPGCNARFICNPNRIDSTYPHPEICGAQVAHMLLTHYARCFDRAKSPAIAQLEIFAGIGALTDVMPLAGPTRALVRRACGWLALCVPDIEKNPWGSFDAMKAHNADIESATVMQLLAAGNHHPAYVDAFAGLVIMMRELAVAKKLTTIDNINVSFIGFTVGPMFNATRRIEGYMEDTFAVFMPSAIAPYYPNARVERVASMRQVIANNELRKQLTKDAMSQMADSEQPYAPYVFFAEAPGGIMGLLASNMMRLTGLPTVVLNPKTLSGSARAPQGVPIIDIAHNAATKHNMPKLRAIGHQQACGFRAGSRAGVDAYAREIDEFVQQLPKEELDGPRADLWLVDPGNREVKPHYSDTELDSSAYADALAHADAYIDNLDALIYLHQRIEGLSPYGAGFTYPLIDITAEVDACEITTMGASKQHVKIVTPSGFTFLWWNSAEEIPAITAAESFTARVELGVNTFRGRTTPQGIVQHMSLHTRPEAAARAS